VRVVAPAVGALPGAAGVAGPHIACVGPLEAAWGFHDAVWAFDILHQVHPDLRLRIAGDGLDRAPLGAFARGLRNDHRVDFLGRAAGPGLLPGAVALWAPSRANVGRQAALEALAAGCPVIAADVPCLREAVEDGATGYVVRPGDVVGLARRTHALLQDPALRARLSAAARRRMATGHEPAAVAGQWRALYQRCAA
jgi:glycosyltransferase involved in cell wall biosynthesis